ncbi:hypothetical protein BDV09DRAFT_52761 [Aspergillus tetrazonus]
MLQQLSGRRRTSRQNNPLWITTTAKQPIPNRYHFRDKSTFTQSWLRKTVHLSISKALQLEAPSHRASRLRSPPMGESPVRLPLQAADHSGFLSFSSPSHSLPLHHHRPSSCQFLLDALFSPLLPLYSLLSVLFPVSISLLLSFIPCVLFQSIAIFFPLAGAISNSYFHFLSFLNRRYSALISQRSRIIF